MKIRLFFLLLSLLLCQWTIAQQTVSSGKLIEYSRFNSTIVPSRNVFVWLPTGYSTRERYDVLYMHVGKCFLMQILHGINKNGELMKL